MTITEEIKALLDSPAVKCVKTSFIFNHANGDRVRVDSEIYRYVASERNNIVYFDGVDICAHQYCQCHMEIQSIEPTFQEWPELSKGDLVFARGFGKLRITQIDDTFYSSTYEYHEIDEDKCVDEWHYFGIQDLVLLKKAEDSDE